MDIHGTQMISSAKRAMREELEEELKPVIKKVVQVAFVEEFTARATEQARVVLNRHFTFSVSQVEDSVRQVKHVSSATVHRRSCVVHFILGVICDAFVGMVVVHKALNDDALKKLVEDSGTFASVLEPVREMIRSVNDSIEAISAQASTLLHGAPQAGNELAQALNGLATLGKRDIPDSDDGPATVAKSTKKPTLPQGQRSVLDLFGLSNKK